MSMGRTLWRSVASNPFLISSYLIFYLYENPLRMRLLNRWFAFSGRFSALPKWDVDECQELRVLV